MVCRAVPARRYARSTPPTIREACGRPGSCAGPTDPDRTRHAQDRPAGLGSTQVRQDRQLAQDGVRADLSRTQKVRSASLWQTWLDRVAFQNDVAYGAKKRIARR
jgi:hypothetical protein